MSNYSLRLPAKVKAVNRANALANQYHPALRAALVPFLGQKICKVDGTLLQKVKDAINAVTLPYTARESIYRGASNYSIFYVAKTCESLGDFGCTYHETSFYIGELDGQVLKNLDYQFPRHRTDFTEQEVTDKREAFKVAQRAAQAAESALSPFGHHDN